MWGSTDAHPENVVSWGDIEIVEREPSASTVTQIAADPGSTVEVWNRTSERTRRGAE